MFESGVLASLDFVNEVTKILESLFLCCFAIITRHVKGKG